MPILAALIFVVAGIVANLVDLDIYSSNKKFANYYCHYYDYLVGVNSFGNNSNSSVEIFLGQLL
jgi:hypothetical protein